MNCGVPLQVGQVKVVQAESAAQLCASECEPQLPEPPSPPPLSIGSVRVQPASRSSKPSVRMRSHLASGAPAQALEIRGATLRNPSDRHIPGRTQRTPPVVGSDEESSACQVRTAARAVAAG
jgi:hypothetical protein